MKLPQIGCLVEVRKKKKWSVLTMRENCERNSRTVENLIVFRMKKRRSRRRAPSLATGIGRNERTRKPSRCDWLRGYMQTFFLFFLEFTIFFSVNLWRNFSCLVQCVEGFCIVKTGKDFQILICRYSPIMRQSCVSVVRCHLKKTLNFKVIRKSDIYFIKLTFIHFYAVK